VADEVPLEAVAEELLLADEILRRVLSKKLHARFMEHGDLGRLVVFAGD
jgi:hypothetical protein